MNSSFYLRTSGSNKPSLIYFCVSDGKDKQHKRSMGVKLLNSQWNSKKQEPIISNLFSVEANKCALMCFERIMQVKCVYLQYLNYLCTTNEVFSIDKLKEIIEQGFTERKSSPFLIRTMTDIEYNNSIIYSNCTIETPTTTKRKKSYERKDIVPSLKEL